jgi:hypothetical protein
MKRITKLLARTEDAIDEDLYITLFTDGGGFVKYFVDDKELLEFKDENDLRIKLQGLIILKTNRYELN